ncbi:MAG: rhomboid family intramembrane serine protease [Acidobacteriales bacterium]|nr:rhomboid family intramembrane serine protease [Terriglobales bacterium]
MAVTCSRCGRDLPSFSIGNRPEVCPECQEQSQAPDFTGLSFPVTNSILAINVAVFVAMLVTGGSLSGGPIEHLIRWGANHGPLTLGGEWWRLFTCAFVHIGIVHLLINMWCLWNLGPLAELHLGRVEFAMIYCACAILASLASLLWNPNNVSAGASGALFGIAGALISTSRLGTASLSREELKEQMTSLVPFVLYNLFIGAVSPRIDNAAHVGGLIGGLALGGLIAITSRERHTTPKP